MDFHQSFRICVTQQDLELIRFWGYLATTVATVLDFWVLKFVGVPQPKPMQGFSPNVQDMLTPRGSRAD